MNFIELTVANHKKNKILVSVDSINYIVPDVFLDEPTIIVTNGGELRVTETYEEIYTLIDKFNATYIRSAND